MRDITKVGTYGTVKPAGVYRKCAGSVSGTTQGVNRVGQNTGTAEVVEGSRDQLVGYLLSDCRIVGWMLVCGFGTSRNSSFVVAFVALICKWIFYWKGYCINLCINKNMPICYAAVLGISVIVGDKSAVFLYPG